MVNTVRFVYYSLHSILKKMMYYLFIWLRWVSVVAHGIFDLHCGMQTLSCGMWELVPQPGIEPRSLALGAWSLTHWTTREALHSILSSYDILALNFFFPIMYDCIYLFILIYLLFYFTILQWFCHALT